VDDANSCALRRLVIDTLEPLPQDRTCFRMVNGVLVERTVADVLPTLKTNSDGLKQVLEDMLKQYKSKQSELDNWKVRLPTLMSSPVQIVQEVANFWHNRKRIISRLYNLKRRFMNEESRLTTMYGLST
jgi:hypothetical protein